MSHLNVGVFLVRVCIPYSKLVTLPNHQFMAGYATVTVTCTEVTSMLAICMQENTHP